VRRLRREEGYALVWASGAVLVMVLALAGGVEVARMHALASSVQAAVDAAALSGALSGRLEEDRDPYGRVVERRLVLDEAAVRAAAEEALRRNVESIRRPDGYPNLASWSVSLDRARAAVGVEARVEERSQFPLWGGLWALSRYGEAQAGAVASRLLVSPEVVHVEPGQTAQVVVRAVMSDGSQVSVSAQASYVPADPLVVQSEGGGFLRGLSTGITVVEIGWEGLSAACNVVCAQAGVASYDVAPRPVRVAVGQTGPFWVILRRPDGTAVDVTGEVSCSVEDAQVARVAGTGLLEGRGAGTTVLVVRSGASGPVLTRCTVEVGR